METLLKGKLILLREVIQQLLTVLIEIMLGIKNNTMLLTKRLGTMKLKKALKDTLTIWINRMKMLMQHQTQQKILPFSKDTVKHLSKKKRANGTVILSNMFKWSLSHSKKLQNSFKNHTLNFNNNNQLSKEKIRSKERIQLKESTNIESRLILKSFHT